jgi:hypothetical protein
MLPRAAIAVSASSFSRKEITLVNSLLSGDGGYSNTLSATVEMVALSYNIGKLFLCSRAHGAHPTKATNNTATMIIFFISTTFLGKARYGWRSSLLVWVILSQITGKKAWYVTLICCGQVSRQQQLHHHFRRFFCPEPLSGVDVVEFPSPCFINRQRPEDCELRGL